MNSIKSFFTKARTLKIFVLVSVIAILGIALCVYSFAIETYAIIISHEHPAVSLEKPAETSVKDRIAKVSPEYKELLWNLAKCESRFNEFAVGINKGSIDRGVFQINNKFQKEVSDECAFNVECATKWTVNEIKTGGIHQWSCKNKI